MLVTDTNVVEGRAKAPGRETGMKSRWVGSRYEKKVAGKMPFPPPPGAMRGIDRGGDAGDRPPLPSGHPTAWAVLTEGTILQGTAYPLPVFP